MARLTRHMWRHILRRPNKSIAYCSLCIDKSQRKHLTKIDKYDRACSKSLCANLATTTVHRSLLKQLGLYTRSWWSAASLLATVRMVTDRNQMASTSRHATHGTVLLNHLVRPLRQEWPHRWWATWPDMVAVLQIGCLGRVPRCRYYTSSLSSVAQRQIYSTSVYRLSGEQDIRKFKVPHSGTQFSNFPGSFEKSVQISLSVAALQLKILSWFTKYQR